MLPTLVPFRAEGDVVTVADEIRQCLADLDGFGDERAIARFLESWGFRGRRRATGSCPLATYLQTVTGEAGIRVAADRTAVSGDGTTQFVAHAAPVRRFVAAFDRGEFPRLAVEPDRPSRIRRARTRPAARRRERVPAPGPSVVHGGVPPAGPRREIPDRVAAVPARQREGQFVPV